VLIENSDLFQGCFTFGQNTNIMRILFYSIVFILINTLSNGQNLPIGYIKYFETGFSETKLHKHILVSPAAEVLVNKGIFSIKSKPDSLNYFFPPSTIIIDSNVFGDYIVEMRVNMMGKQIDGEDGIYLITGLRDSLNYYFVRISDSGACFSRMYKGKITMVSFDSSFTFTSNLWQNLRIERDILTRTFTIINGNKKFVCTDANLVMGFFGVGTKNKKLLIDKITIWAPTSINTPAPLFW
jgi:hypothetical protein